MSKKIYKPKPISGFPEWLPEERLVEQRWFDHVRKVFESYGYCNIETPSVEEIDVLLAKGEVDKEIYEIRRIHAEEGDKDSRLALHFDQTVPFARYTAQHFNDLVFPFKRYQMQRVWRGERPQMGRMREFYQCDIDVINVDHLPLSFDAEVAAMMFEVLQGLNIGKVQMRISNRKILRGLLEALGIDDSISVTRIIDKMEKLERKNILTLLKEQNISEQAIDTILTLVSSRLKRSEMAGSALFQDPSAMLGMTITNTMQEGLVELQYVLNALSHLPDEAVMADLSIVRGLDYYTGTVYETQLLEVPEFTGSVCSGGRYDDLAGGFINKHLPGVGISLGFSRLFDVIRQSRPDLLKAGAKTPADILMVIPSEEKMSEAHDTARFLRQRGFKVEAYHAAAKIGKQLSYAEKKGIPYIWFPPFEEGKPHEVKNMATSKQISADPQTWEKE